MNGETIRSTKTDKKLVEKKKRGVTNLGFAAGGFVAGMAVTNAFPMNREDVELIETDEIDEIDSVDSVVDESEPQELDVTTSDIDNGLPHYTEAPIAQVSDSQSFAQAFADARRQVGPGGIFEWHGNVYGTYYADEWNSMTQEQRGDYWASVNATNASHTVVAEQEDDNYSDGYETDDSVFVTVEDVLIPPDTELLDENDPPQCEGVMNTQIFEPETSAMVEPNPMDFDSNADVSV